MSPTLQVTAQNGGGGGVPWGWTVAVALVAALAGYFGPLLLRRTGKETTAAARRTNELTADSIANAVEARLNDRMSALELDKWRRREETMRMLRWAGEQATKGEDQADAWRIGLATMEALGRSELLQQEDQELIDAVLQALYAEAEAEYAEDEARRGEPPDVILDEE